MLLDEYGVPMDLMDPVVLGSDYWIHVLENFHFHMFSLKWIETNDFNAKFGVGTI